MSKEFPAFQDKTAICIVGRFQPPHRGHLRLVKEAKSEFMKGKFDAIFFIIIEGKKTSEDKTRNPLTGEERKKYLETLKLFNGVKIIVAPQVLDGFKMVREQGYEPKAIVGGTATSDNPEENTAKSYKDLLDKYFTNNGELVRHKMVMVKRDPNKPDTDDVGVSGTIVRNAAQAKNYDVFRQCLPFSDDITKEIYNKIVGEKE